MRWRTRSYSRSHYACKRWALSFWRLQFSWAGLLTACVWHALRLPAVFKAGFGKTYHPGQPKEYDCVDFPTDCPSWSVPYQPGARTGRSADGVPPNGCHNVSAS
eukprot:SAG22_NODE_6322_length_870_cov_1.274968_1_plen_103_part_01